MQNKAISQPRWFNAWRRTGRPAPDTDAADLGTAFGLDLSLNETHPDVPAPAARAPGWMRRLTGRRRAAT